MITLKSGVKVVNSGEIRDTHTQYGVDWQTILDMLHALHPSHPSSQTVERIEIDPKYGIYIVEKPS